MLWVQRLERGLGRRVMHEIRVASLVRRLAADVDDDTAPAAAEMGHRFAAQVRGGEHVDLERSTPDRVPFIEIRFRIDPRVEGRVVDQDVDSASPGYRRAPQRENAVVGSEIGLHPVAPIGTQGVCQGTRPFGALAIVEHDAGAGVREFANDRRSDSAGPTRDQRDLVRELGHRSRPGVIATLRVRPPRRLEPWARLRIAPIRAARYRGRFR